MTPAPCPPVPWTDDALGDIAAALAAAFAEEQAGAPEAADEWRDLVYCEWHGPRLFRPACRLIRADGAVAAACMTNLDAEVGIGRIGATGVHPGHQRRGMGRAVVAASMAALREAGATALVLEVAEANTHARALYESLGFRAERQIAAHWTRKTLVDSERVGSRPTHRFALTEARRQAPGLHPERPTFQRRPRFTDTFIDGVIAWAVTHDDQPTGRPIGILQQRGASILDLAAVPDPAVVSALLQAATALSYRLRLIGVPEDDPLAPLLPTLGFVPEPPALEMWCRILFA